MSSKLANALDRNKPNMRITDERDDLYVIVYGREKIRNLFPLIERVLTHDYENKIIIPSKYYSWPYFREMIIGDNEPKDSYYNNELGTNIREYLVRDIFEEAKLAKIYRDFLFIAYEL